jgi:hypothetical protein
MYNQLETSAQPFLPFQPSTFNQVLSFNPSQNFTPFTPSTFYNFNRQSSLDSPKSHSEE